MRSFPPLRCSILVFVAGGFVSHAQPVAIDPGNPHYFRYQGRTTVLVTSGEHYGSVLNPDFNYSKYLATLQADGLNLTRLFGGSYAEAPSESFGILRNTLAPARGKFLPPWARSKEDGYGGGGAKFDLDRWNPAYFERLHGFLDDAARRGVVVELSLFTSQYSRVQWGLSPFNPHNNVNRTNDVDWKKLNTLGNGNIQRYQDAYVRKLVSEVNRYDNVIIEICNEPWADNPVKVDVKNPYLPEPGRDQFPNSIDVAGEPSLEWQKHLADVIADEETRLPKKHLIAHNYSNFGFPVKQVSQHVSVLNFHYAFPESVRLNYGLRKPISYDESGFLGREDAVYRRQAWNFMLAGGAAFDGLDYSFTVGHEDGTDLEKNGPGGGSPAFRKQLAILRRFLDALPLNKMDSDSGLIQHATVPACALSDRKREHAIYLDGDGVIDLTLKVPDGQYTVQWLNTVTGGVQRESVQSAGGTLALHSPKCDNGIALHVIGR